MALHSISLVRQSASLALVTAPMSKEPSEATPLTKAEEVSGGTPAWVMRYGAPLALTFYITVAVVKTMLTKVHPNQCG